MEMLIVKKAEYVNDHKLQLTFNAKEVIFFKISNQSIYSRVE